MAGHDGGVLHEVRHFLQQRRMRCHEATHAATQPAGMSLQLTPNPGLALAAIENHEILE